MYRYYFEKLTVWQDAKDLGVKIYKICQGFPKQEMYGLASQLQRAAVSVTANISEGSSRSTSKDQAYFSTIAYGSTMEVLNLIIIAHELGYGIYANELKSLVEELGVTDRVIFLGPVMKLQVPDFLNRIDAAYIGVKRSPLYRFGVSFTKLNDIIMAGQPVVFAAELPENIVQESGAGITCPPEDPQALGKALVKMKAMGNDERDAMGKKGRDWVIKNHDFKLLAGRYLDAENSFTK